MILPVEPLDQLIVPEQPEAVKVTGVPEVTCTAEAEMVGASVNGLKITVVVTELTGQVPTAGKV